MKKLTLVIFLFLYASVMYAQAPLKPVNPKTIGPLKTTAGDGMLAANDITTNLALARELSVFNSLMKDAGLLSTYQSKGPITIFVPVNMAFEKLPAGRVDSLMKHAHIWELTRIISYHAIAGMLKAKDIEKEIAKSKGMATFTTLAGNKLNAKIDANRNIVLIDENGGESVINRFDIEQSNGMMHLVNKVLLPKAKVI